MHITKLRLKNWCRHLDAEFEFKPGINGIIGGVGSGKSSILSAIAFAITGVATAHGTKTDNLAHGKKSGYVELEFVQGTHTYCIKRSIEKAAQLLTLPDGETLSRGEEVTAALTRLLGVNTQVILNNVFATQKEIDRILYTTPSARLQEFQQAFNLQRAALAHKALGIELASLSVTPGLRERLAEASSQLAEVDAKLSEAKSVLASTKTKVEQLLPARDVVRRAALAKTQSASIAAASEEVSKAESELVSALTQYEALLPMSAMATSELAGIDARLSEAYSVVVQAKTKVARIAGLRTQLDDIAKRCPAELPDETALQAAAKTATEAASAAVVEVERLKGILNNPPVVKAQADAEARLGAIREELAGIRTFNAEQQAELDRLGLEIGELSSHVSGFETGTCPTCGQEVNGGPEESAKLLAKISELKSRKAAIVAEATATEAAARQALQQETKALNQLIAETKAKVREITTRKLADAKAVLLEATALEARASKAVSDYQAVAADLKMAESYRQQLAELEANPVDPVAADRLHSELVAAKTAASKVLSDFKMAETKLDAAKRRKDAAETALSRLSQSVDMPPEHELAEAIKMCQQLSGLEAVVASTQEIIGTKTAEQSGLRSEVDKLSKQLALEARNAKWAGIVSTVRDALHVTEFPARVMHEYAKLLNQQMAFYMQCWEAPFKFELDNELCFVAEFPDGYRPDAVRLSGGQAIIAATAFRFAMSDLFAKNIGLLVLDEPSNNLGEAEIAKLQKLLLKLSEMAGKSNRQIIIVTHEVTLTSFLENVIEL